MKKKLLIGVASAFVAAVAVLVILSAMSGTGPRCAVTRNLCKQPFGWSEADDLCTRTLQELESDDSNKAPTETLEKQCGLVNWQLVRDFGAEPDPMLPTTEVFDLEPIKKLTLLGLTMKDDPAETKAGDWFSTSA